MTAPHVEYELFVRDIFETLLRAQGVDTVKVEQDVQVQGISRSHQVDVFWEFRLAGVLHRVIINCKRYATAVEVGDVEQMKGVLSDVPDARGLLVTTVGYQQGAVDFAKIHGIGLKVIRKPEDADWGGRIRQMNITFFDPRGHGPTIKTQVRFDARAIVRDAIAGTLLFVQEDGIVKGDTEAEGIPRPPRP